MLSNHIYRRYGDAFACPWQCALPRMLMNTWPQGMNLSLKWLHSPSTISRWSAELAIFFPSNTNKSNIYRNREGIHTYTDDLMITKPKIPPFSNKCRDVDKFLCTQVVYGHTLSQHTLDLIFYRYTVYFFMWISCVVNGLFPWLSQWLLLKMTFPRNDWRFQRLANIWSSVSVLMSYPPVVLCVFECSY